MFNLSTYVVLATLPVILAPNTIVFVVVAVEPEPCTNEASPIAYEFTPPA